MYCAREITDPDDVQGRDVRFDGVEYNSGKLWHESVEKWLEGFRRVQNTNTQEVLADQEKLEAILHECLERYHGYVTVRLFSIHTGLTYYSAPSKPIKTDKIVVDCLGNPNNFSYLSMLFENITIA